MWLTITLIVVAIFALVALEEWFFWRLGEREDGTRSRQRRRLESQAPETESAMPRRSSGQPRRRGAQRDRALSGPVSR
jgi:hypothetical protein